MAKGLVNRIIPFSSVDGPGNRTAIFLQGCNFNCLYCHNPETINTYCNGSPKVMLMDTGEVINEIKKVVKFINGITVSGGECMLQTEFLISLFEEIKNMELTTFIDTNGSIPFWENQKLLVVMDMAMLDIKSFDNKEHIKLTGMNNFTVLKNAEYLGSIGKLYEIRTVIVPDVLDNYTNVDSISKLITKINPSIRYKLIKYRSIGARKKMIDSSTPSNEMMNELFRISKANGCNNVVIT